MSQQTRARILVVIFAFSALVGIYSIITSYQGLRAAEVEVQEAQKDYDIAVQEQAAAQERYSNLVKYGCTNPQVGPGFVSCP
jgi:hypothetical protein